MIKFQYYLCLSSGATKETYEDNGRVLSFFFVSQIVELATSHV